MIFEALKNNGSIKNEYNKPDKNKRNKHRHKKFQDDYVELRKIFHKDYKDHKENKISLEELEDKLNQYIIHFYQIQ